MSTIDGLCFLDEIKLLLTRRRLPFAFLLFFANRWLRFLHPAAFYTQFLHDGYTGWNLQDKAWLQLKKRLLLILASECLKKKKKKNPDRMKRRYGAPVPRGSNQWMNDELPSPPKLCRNNTMAPILQSLIRGSSLVALLPLNIRGWGYVRQCSSERIKEPRTVLIRNFSEYSPSDTVFFFLPFQNLINVSRKENDLLPSSGLNSSVSQWCKL